MAVVRYTLLRLLIFAVIAALFWLIGFRGYVLLLSAVFASGVVSVVVLRRSRDDVSASLDARLSTIKDRLESRTEAEDAWNDAERARTADSEPEQGGSRGGAVA
ncbi:DUF4229 domain-containing protein [Phytoactinopolyspora halotolerans]|uniref:DUF4229 domain-containing protein n=1 Tax=Phytoactinopolyspora halotolerans TaxID=1981512 RepID=A0A6L9S580_9ACTN|nr:DUF4229 domain-containing protein [Phytoactinopolyspora halotolerans]NEE00316.1 DUF4229 domain-containing protein [Phytoactinopolyspora halotolerans]